MAIRRAIAVPAVARKKAPAFGGPSGLRAKTPWPSPSLNSRYARTEYRYLPVACRYTRGSRTATAGSCSLTIATAARARWRSWSSAASTCAAGTASCPIPSHVWCACALSRTTAASLYVASLLSTASTIWRYRGRSKPGSKRTLTEHLVSNSTRRTDRRNVVQHHPRTRRQQSYNMLYNMFVCSFVRSFVRLVEFDTYRTCCRSNYARPSRAWNSAFSNFRHKVCNSECVVGIYLICRSILAMKWSNMTDFKWRSSNLVSLSCTVIMSNIHCGNLHSCTTDLFSRLMFKPIVNQNDRPTCAKSGQSILRKIFIIVATRCHLLRLKCTKFDFG